MKIHRLNHLLCATAVSSVILLAVGCSDKKTATDTTASANQPAPSQETLPAVSNPAPAARTPDPAVPMTLAADQAAVAPDGWAAIKDDTYEQRTHFSSGLQTMASGMDSRIATMNSKPGSMSDSQPNAAMTEVTAARTNLRAASDKLDQATPDTWMDDKSLVAQAWVRMQAACTKAQSS